MCMRFMVEGGGVLVIIVDDIKKILIYIFDLKELLYGK